MSRIRAHLINCNVLYHFISKKKSRPLGSEALPEGIVSKTSNLEMRPLWGDVKKKFPHSVNLLGIAVGIKQKELVNKIVEKFLKHDFVVMLFHYDGVVDAWNNLDWSSRAIHSSAMNQTKWIRDCLAQLYAKDITPDDKQELDEALQRENLN